MMASVDFAESAHVAGSAEPAIKFGFDRIKKYEMNTNGSILKRFVYRPIL